MKWGTEVCPSGALVHALCSMWAGSELALLNSLSEMLLLRMSGGMMPETTGR